MISDGILYQIHGYRNGHQLIDGNVRHDTEDQDAIDRLSDISGALKPGEQFAPYISCYPLPSARYFVLAKTWQDLTAHRAGCVFTKSFFLPISYWENTKSVTNLFEGLRNLKMDGDSKLAISADEQFATHSISPFVTEELVEAIFLENRKPILIFNCADAEYILEKLYSVFWPDQRKTFASCTFALGMRSINGKPFDILFAPSSVKSRFSEWPGRRIDALNSDKNSRHRWTRQLVQGIFESTPPRLLPNESFELFYKESRSHGEVVRIQLLWNELFEKAEVDSSPLALLGLLDIANSQDTSSDKLYSALKPLVPNLVTQALIKLGPNEAWKFYSAILVKYKKKLLPRTISKLIRDSCRTLVSLDVEEAISFILNFQKTSHLHPLTLYSGLGDGIASNGSISRFLHSNHSFLAEVLLLFMSASNEFCQALISVPTFEEDLSLQCISEGLDSSNHKAVNRAWANLVSHVSLQQHSKILKLLLAKGTDAQIKSAIDALRRANSFNVASLNNLIFDAASKSNLLEHFRNSIQQVDISEQVIDLLVLLINAQPNEIYWLCYDSSYDQVIMGEIIRRLFNGLTPKVADLFSRDHNIALAALSSLTLIGDNQSAANFALHFQLTGETVWNCLKKLSEAELAQLPRDPLSQFISQTLIDDQDISHADLQRVLSKAGQIDKNRLLYDILIQANGSSTISTALTTYLAVGPLYRDCALEHIDFVSDRLANQLDKSHHHEIHSLWAQLILESSFDRSTQCRAAEIMLDYAFGIYGFDPTGMVLCSFPFVYSGYKKSDPNFKILNLWFVDWDKCRTLRETLVSRYIDSNWSRIGLFEVSLASGIEEEVFKILVHKRHGKTFIKQAIDELQRNELPNSHPVVKAFRKYFS